MPDGQAVRPPATTSQPAKGHRPAADQVAAGAARSGTSTAVRVRAAGLAAGWVLAGRRLEMHGLADELGVSRMTLFRHVGGRDELLADALWLLTERTLMRARRTGEAERPPGAPLCVGVGRAMNALVSQSAPLHKLLEDEPALTIRVLTDPRGKVQTGVVAFVEALLRQDMAEHGFRALVDPGELAFALVRLGESFLYADVLAARRPDVEAANRLQQALIESAHIIEHDRPQPDSPDRSGRP